MSEKVLELRDVSVRYTTDGVISRAVNHVSFSLEKGEVLGLVGETGAGKTTTALSIMGLLPKYTSELEGEILFRGQNLTGISERNYQKIRGNHITMIFQDPMTSLNPVFSVGSQIADVIRLHNPQMNSGQIEARIDELLKRVGIPPERKREYPHQFSGGMKQRIMIAIAIACNPELLIADEPTTALDVTIQAQVIRMMKELKNQLDTSVILITHDLGIVANFCDKVAIMYGGEIVEYGSYTEIFDSAREHHPYTKGLFASLPNIEDKKDRLTPIDGLMPHPAELPEGCRFHPRCPQCMEKCKSGEVFSWNNGEQVIRCNLYDGEPAPALEKEQAGEEKRPGRSQKVQEGGVLLECQHLKKYFNTPKGRLHAVDDISFQLERGKTLGIVGESGCGKSTLSRTILKLLEPTEGKILFDGQDITRYKKREMLPLRRDMQIIFQDPYASLDPKMTVFELIEEPLKAHKVDPGKKERMARVEALMDLVGLDRRYINTYPHELDGGRRQRIGIAKALALNPKFIICDEPVSALDVSIQAQILNLMMDLKDELGLTYIFVSHDLSVVKHISDDIMVLYLGKTVELAKTEDLFQNPLHPYTKALLSAIPAPDIRYRDKEAEVMKGEVTSPIEPPPGCRFAARCPLASERCFRESPELQTVQPGHLAACHLYNKEST